MPRPAGRERGVGTAARRGGAAMAGRRQGGEGGAAGREGGKAGAAVRVGASMPAGREGGKAGAPGPPGTSAKRDGSNGRGGSNGMSRLLFGPSRSCSFGSGKRLKPLSPGGSLPPAMSLPSRIVLMFARPRSSSAGDRSGG